MALNRSTRRRSAQSFLDGKCLIAMPATRDERFERSVVYVCAHSGEGAMGIIVNQPAPNVHFSELLTQLGVVKSTSEIVASAALEFRVHKGGPVETGRGFVLHSDDVLIENSTLVIGGGICLTATLDILKSIARGKGPHNALLALGYAGWGAGQLEREIHANGWLHCDADPDLLFDAAIDTKYDRALRKLGIMPGMLSQDAGHA